jgi:hypothetical protein
MDGRTEGQTDRPTEGFEEDDHFFAIILPKHLRNINLPQTYSLSLLSVVCSAQTAVVYQYSINKFILLWVTLFSLR